LFPGVPLFFLVSGFLITDSYLNSGNLKEYFIKRALRIYPALSVNILVLELAMYVGKNFNDISVLKYIEYFVLYVITAASGIAGFIIGIKNDALYNYDGFFSSYPSGVLWTLSVELSFYILLPFILCIRKAIIRNLLLVFLFFASMIIPAIADENFYSASNLNKLLELICLPFLWIFIIGMVMRLYWLDIKKYLVGYGLFYIAFYLIFCFVAIEFGSGLGDYKRGLEISTVFQIFLLALAMFSMAFSYTNLKMARSTDLSYSTYLYHMLIVQILISLGFGSSLWLYFIVVAATLAVAYVSWNFIEKPALTLKQIKVAK
uniref:acyltransferase family protein n=1 Tax=uncultured Campylobacter sp. TaxID=218934 RepID=UPI002623C986